MLLKSFQKHPIQCKRFTKSVLKAIVYHCPVANNLHVITSQVCSEIAGLVNVSCVHILQSLLTNDQNQ